MAEKTITEHLSELEKAVKDAEAKQGILTSAEQAKSKASTDYNNAVDKVQKLQAEIQGRIGNIFPAAGRVKVSS